MKDELEQLIISSVTDGVMKSSLLASSLASHLMQDPHFIAKMIASLDTTVLVDAIAREYIRRAMSGVNEGSRWVSATNVEKKIAHILADRMAEDVRLA